MFLAQIASVKQWGIFHRESGVEKGLGGVTICLYFSTWHPCVFHVFERLPCITSKNYYLFKGKKRLLISCQISPKENDALVACQLGTNARKTPYTLCSKFKPILLRSLKNVL